MCDSHALTESRVQFVYDKRSSFESGHGGPDEGLEEESEEKGEPDLGVEDCQRPMYSL